MEKIVIGKGQADSFLVSNKLNRHGIIAGATGTGKTVTLKVLAEKISELGVPVFLSDIKGDLGSIAKKGEVTEKIQERLDKLGITDFEPTSYTTEFYDIFGEAGIPIRTTVSEMGPILLSQLLGLNDTQEGILNIAFKLADDEKLLLIDLKDLRAMLNYVGEKAGELKTTYGNITTQSIGAILRSLLILEQQGGNLFFGEPSFNINDLLRVDSSGRGIVNVLASEKLFLSPKLYATFLLWFLSELYENLPEVGDLDKPKLVFFFDEAHVLFENISPVVLEKVELIVRLIRSKGVGIFFITQNPTDVPDSIGSQLGNRIQHGLRAFTPKEQKTVKAVAETFRQETGQDLEKVVTELKVGQAVVSFQQEDGSPSYADVLMIYPPKSSLQAIDELSRQQVVNQSVLYGKYADSVDRVSAHEQLAEIEKAMAEARSAGGAVSDGGAGNGAASGGAGGAQQKEQRPVAKRTDDPMDRFTKNLMSSVSREVGRIITRGIMGIFKGK